ncbi:AT-hook motif nuclear-localized protein 28-like [Cornus florida]|uniref:AT-hook motif nuclear-localized protein 28-like n=1 Tax=Cornus florida TaxID=4283 RepID=UPI0028987823|nr:AT-hook motif nuclear-localized protein 28-like [Cornus florida]
MADYAATISLSQARSLSHTSEEEEEHSPRSVPPLSNRPKITTINHRSLAVGGGGDSSSAGHELVVSTASPTSRKPRGRPLGSKNKPKPPVVITRESESAMKPAVLEISAGSDVIEMVGRFARSRRLGLTVLGGSGTVCDVTLRHVVLRGPFNILSLTGTILGSSSSSSSSCGFAITVSGPQGQVFGGVVAGKVVAESAVVVVAATFMTPTFHRLPCTKVEEPDHHEAATKPLPPPMSISEGCSSTGMSMSIYGVAAPTPLNCQISPDHHVLPWGPTSRPSPPY